MASQIPREFIDQLLQKTDIIDIVASCVSLKKFGANYKACCPFHDEKTPSFVVSSTKQIYHCFGCGVGGNVISFVMEHDRATFLDAVKTLAQRAHLALPTEVGRAMPKQSSERLYDLMQEASCFYENQLKISDTERVKAYLIQRGLSGTVAKQFGLGYAPAAWEDLLQYLKKKQFSVEEMFNAGLLSKKESGKYFDKFRDRIMFPIHDRQGRVIAFGGRVLDNTEPKYLNSPETPIFHKSNELYGLYHSLKTQRHHDYFIVTEGYMDVLALVQHGVTQVVGTLGTATTEQHLQLLFRYTDKIIFCFDGDKAGRKAAWRALTVCLPKLSANKSLHFVLLPEGEDPDSFIHQHGQEGFRSLVQQAMSMPDFFIQFLVAGLNLNLADHRAKFLHHANQLLKTLSDVELQRVLAQEIAERSRVPVIEILKILKTPKKQAEVMSRLSQTVVPSHLRKIIAILLQYPHHAASVSDLVMGLSSYDFLKELVNIIVRQKILTSSAIVEYFRETSYAKAVVELAAQPLLLSEEHLVQELHAILKKITSDEKNQTMELLMKKAQKSSLTFDEKQQLHEWLKLKNR